MNRFAPAIDDLLARLALAVLVAAGVASCSGAVSGTPVVNDPSRILILPGTATAFSGLPTTFTITGGTGAYIASSSNQAVIHVSGSVNGGTLTVVPEPVLADTTVTITVRDTGTTTPATSTVTVKPGTINNDITITPSSTQGTICPTGTVCSGGDAVVSATLSQGGIPLPARGVRFEVISGDFLFITSAPGATTETLATSITVITDERGKATARIRAGANASNQTAILQVTDLGTGAFQRTGFVIAQATGTSPGFFATPTAATFQGARTDQCASSTDANGGSINATFYIFGGVPPYTANSTSSAFSLDTNFVSQSGGGFRVFPNGQCVDTPGAPIVIRDTSGRTVTVTVANIRGTEAIPPLTVAPDAVSLSSCSSRATIRASGGTGTYNASAGSGALLIERIDASTFIIRRQPSSAASTSPVNVGISDGVSSVNVTVNLTGNGAGTCPTPAINVNPASVTLTGCSPNAATVNMTGGSGSYSASSPSLALRTSITGATLTIDRRPGSGAAPAGSLTVTVTDSTDPGVTAGTVTVNAAGSGSC